MCILPELVKSKWQHWLICPLNPIFRRSQALVLGVGMGGKQENLAAFEVIRQTLEKIEKKKIIKIYKCINHFDDLNGVVVSNVDC
jgi:hypothetical protein